jgi:DNA polymerase IV
MVKFNPYIPQSIQLGLGLLDPTAGRFLVEGSPTQTKLSVSVPASQFSASQGSLQIKSSERQLAAHQLQETDSVPKDTSSLEIVKDSFSYEEPPEPEDTYNDALSKAIQETKAIAHLPLDEEEDDASSPTSNQDSDISTDDEDPEPVPKRPKPSKLLPTAPKDQGKIPSNAFQCMNPLGSKSSTNPNARTIKILDQMCKYYDQMQDQWRTLAYRKAITTLRKQTTKITTAKQAAALPFIGTRLADKIEEIVLTSRLRRLDNTRSDATEQVLRLFLGKSYISRKITVSSMSKGGIHKSIGLIVSVQGSTAPGSYKQINGYKPGTGPSPTSLLKLNLQTPKRSV